MTDNDWQLFGLVFVRLVPLVGYVILDILIELAFLEHW